MTDPNPTPISADVIEGMRKAMVQAAVALGEIVPAFNMTRMVMQDQKSRDLAGELVKQGREAIVSLRVALPDSKPDNQGGA